MDGSIFHKGIGSTNPDIGPGTYEYKEDIIKKDEEKRKGFSKNQEIVAFHKLRQLFPEKTSISTVQLNKLKTFEKEHLGPGTYAKASEIQKKTFAGPMNAAFGSNDNRKLDNTTPGIVKNPGPGAYEDKKPSDLNSLEKVESSFFKSAKPRPTNLSGDVNVPGP